MRFMSRSETSLLWSTDMKTAVRRHVILQNLELLYIAILFYLRQKSWHFLRIGLGIIVNRQEFWNLFLVFELSQPI